MKQVRLASCAEMLCSRFAEILLAIVIIAIVALEFAALWNAEAMSPDALFCAMLLGTTLWLNISLIGLSKLARNVNHSPGLQVITSVAVAGFVISARGISTSNPSALVLLVNALPTFLLAVEVIRTFPQAWESYRFEKKDR